MNKKILWIEDDYYMIKGLIHPLQKSGFIIDNAETALEGYNKSLEWGKYDIILVDLILPLSNDESVIPKIVSTWESETYLGIGLIKWLLGEHNVTIPVVALSVINDPISKFGLGHLGVSDFLLKRGLLPSQVKSKVLQLLGLQ